MNPMKSRPERQRVVTWDREGWDAIGDAVGRSADWARRRARRAVDPLPVKMFDGRAVASSELLRAWAKRQEREVSPARTMARRR